jgi:hypothetical protein
MSDTTPPAAKPARPPASPAVRRISQPRLKKIPAETAPSAVTEAAAVPAAASGHGADQPPARAAAVAAAPDAPYQEPVTGAWPEPEAPISGGQATSDAKRKRRRRKGKGQSAQAHAATAFTEENPSSDEDAVEHPAGVATVPPAAAPKHSEAPPPPPRLRPPAPRTKIDPETLANKAWKIFLAEVSEEGVALIGDQDARELARRCFRLAEIFIEEQARHGPNPP